jgi:hypothetical protein
MDVNSMFTFLILLRLLHLLRATKHPDLSHDGGANYRVSTLPKLPIKMLPF